MKGMPLGYKVNRTAWKDRRANSALALTLTRDCHLVKPFSFPRTQKVGTVIWCLVFIVKVTVTWRSLNEELFRSGWLVGVLSGCFEC